MRWSSAVQARKALSISFCQCRNYAADAQRVANAAGLDPTVVGGVDPASTNVEGDEFELPRPGRMRAWQFHDYAGIDGLSLASNVRIPTVGNPTDVLIKVHAASVNPVDVRMLSGYGSQVLNTMRKASKFQPSLVEFPIIPGRDFAGTVVDAGRLTRGLKVGDRVYGTPAPHWQGSHAEYVLAPNITVQPMPKSLSFAEAASLPYAFMTLYSALTLFGDFWIRKPQDERVLVVGASGGIGTLAVQTLKAWGSEVAAVCGTHNVDFVESLGADEIYDYNDPEWIANAKDAGLFDMVLDCATSGSSGGPEELTQLVKKWKFGRYITLTPPILRETDERGLLNGAIRVGTDFARSNISALIGGAKTVRWAFYVPHPRALPELSRLVNSGQLRPVLEKVYNFQELPAAYEQVAAGGHRGKIVIAIASDAEKKDKKTNTTNNATDGKPSASNGNKNEDWTSTAASVAATLGATVGGETRARVAETVGQTLGKAVDGMSQTVMGGIMGMPSGGRDAPDDGGGAPTAEGVGQTIGRAADNAYRVVTNQSELDSARWAVSSEQVGKTWGQAVDDVLGTGKEEDPQKFDATAPKTENKEPKDEASKK